ncbi:hypothetical protein [Fischerella thermalis]|jgi:hypothetical protein|uniref:STAS/SEC14 domain-containing protein n=1 Tax=Fischerella thermalis CCMEE 5318 TaxID=2019666 RepID=A0A2N6L476_9CYAN|nr:hypothetical protein [Fischerella thermalis]PMB15554.1 hypothetical protein CEN46_25715 [Fischerella thermalis CCMEE 5318]
MPTFNEEKWPVVYAHFDGAQTLDGVEQYLRRFDYWLSREEKFYLVLNQTNASAADTNRSKEVHQLETEWIRQNKPRIASYCSGMAMVIDSTEVLNKWQPIATKAIENMFGCPGQAFGTVAEAEEWIEKQNNQVEQSVD